MKWNHIGIKTGNMKKSLHFYLDLLGLKVLEVVDILGKKFYFIGNENFSIEIEEGNPTDTQADMASSTGIYHISLTVDDLRGLVDKLKQNGVLVVFDPLQPRPDRWTSFIQGPDGEFIQLIEYV